MIGTRLHRLTSAVLAFWFTFFVAEPVVVHPCPMHDTVAVRLSQQGHGAAIDAHAGISHAPHDPASHSHHHSCTCLGACAATTSIALSSPRVVALATNDVPVREPSSHFDVVVPSPTPHRLPFANGPPQERYALLTVQL